MATWRSSTRSPLTPSRALLWPAWCAVTSFVHMQLRELWSDLPTQHTCWMMFTRHCWSSCSSLLCRSADDSDLLCASTWLGLGAAQLLPCRSAAASAMREPALSHAVPCCRSGESLSWFLPTHLPGRQLLQSGCHQQFWCHLAMSDSSLATTFSTCRYCGAGMPSPWHFGISKRSFTHRH